MTATLYAKKPERKAFALKRYRSKAAFRRASAFVHIHDVPHTPQREVLIGGKPYYPRHRGERVGYRCSSCGRETHSHTHAGQWCCGRPNCCSAMKGSSNPLAWRSNPAEVGISMLARGGSVSSKRMMKELGF